jgi:hypothetical protein
MCKLTPSPISTRDSWSQISQFTALKRDLYLTFTISVQIYYVLFLEIKWKFQGPPSIIKWLMKGLKK